ncbi:MAG: hypothetical protein LUD47_06660 [Clostridia bacterium]|nr:hypothetical protein [Clostridia bacterium]
MTNPLVDPYLVLSKVYSGGKYLKQALSETQVDPQGRARTARICYGTVEKSIYLDYVIDFNVEKSPKKPVRLVLKIALYMLEFMGKHDYMVVNGAVELVKKTGKGGAAGFVNAFLRSYKIPDMPKDPDERLSLETSAPLWLAKRMREVYGERAEGILNAKSLGLCVRFEVAAEEYLSREHIETPFEGVYIYPNFVRDEKFFDGFYTFQSVGSVAICDIVSPCESLLDACAAPGGKSVLLSKKCAFVVAQDVYPHRVELIKSYVGRMRAENVEPVCADATVFNAGWAEKFDAVLCDVPCTGTGVISENPDIKIFRKEEDVESIVAVQKMIIGNCAKYVKPGGALYYSTCSCLPEEGDGVVGEFLRTTPGFVAEKISSPLVSERTKYGLQFLPDISLGAGFYVAKLVKRHEEDIAGSEL